MAKRSLPCPTVARLLLRYEPETGQLFWKARPRAFGPAGAAKAGAAAFDCPTVYGYLQGGICGGVVVAHRVIWAIVHGLWPNQIDHINGDRADNRLANLREVDDAENRKNTALRADNKSGHHGVRWSEKLGRWRAEIRIGGKSKHIGVYASKAEAVNARQVAESALGFHPNHGKR